MRKALTDLIFPIYTQLGLNTVSEKGRLLRKVMRYLEQDREHFVEIEDPEDAPFSPDSEQGIIGKLAPLAQRETTDEDELHREDITETLFVMVTADKQPLLLHSVERTFLSKETGERSYRFPTFRILEQGLSPDGLVPQDPEAICPIATEHSWNVYCMAFYAFDRLTRHLHPSKVPHKTERAMVVLKHTEKESVPLNDTVYCGKLLPLAIEAEITPLQAEDGETTTVDHLLLLVTEDHAYYVLKTVTTYTAYKKTPLDDAPLDTLFQPDSPEVKTFYKMLDLNDIAKPMFALYN